MVNEMLQATVEIEAKLQEKRLIRTIQMFENAIDDFKKEESNQHIHRIIQENTYIIQKNRIEKIIQKNRIIQENIVFGFYRINGKSERME